jgi:endonuclease YncB( thermonuclease family)
MARRSAVHRRFSARWRIIAVLVAMVLLYLADQSGWLLVAADDDMARYHGCQVRVVAVIDGDTIEIDLPDIQQNRPTTRIRLWGLDSPELARAGQRAEPCALEAKQFLHDVVSEQDVVLILEPRRPRGRYGRILAHVQMLDGRSVNIMVLEAGMARTDDRWTHAMLLQYDRAEAQARQEQRGLWQKDAAP